MRLEVPKTLLKLMGNIYIHNKPLFFILSPHIHRLKGRMIRQMLSELNVLDIIFTRNEGYVTSRLIPGFWKHVGIYVGGNTVIHSIASGVHAFDILDFLRVDSASVVRVPREYWPDREEHLVERAWQTVQDAVKYDWDFDDGNGKVYCSEFVAERVFHPVFENDYIEEYGHRVIPPMNIYESEKIVPVIEFIN